MIGIYTTKHLPFVDSRISTVRNFLNLLYTGSVNLKSELEMDSIRVIYFFAKPDELNSLRLLNVPGRKQLEEMIFNFCRNLPSANSVLKWHLTVSRILLSTLVLSIVIYGTAMSLKK